MNTLQLNGYALPKAQHGGRTESTPSKASFLTAYQHRQHFSLYLLGAVLSLVLLTHRAKCVLPIHTMAEDWSINSVKKS